MTAAQLAPICYAANRAYAIALGENPVPHWEDASPEDRHVWQEAALYLLETPTATPKTLHDQWLRLERSVGWGWGQVLDNDARRHPYHVAYRDLPTQQKGKLFLTLAIKHETTTWTE